MATIINNSKPDHNGIGFLVGVIILIAVVVILFYYGIPTFRTTSKPMISVPSNINVNVHIPNGK